MNRGFRWDALALAGLMAIAFSAGSADAARRRHTRSRSKKKTTAKASRRQRRGPSPASLALYPQDIHLQGQGASQHFVVTAKFKDGATQDVTGQAKIAVGNPKVAGLRGNVVTALAEGKTQLTITMRGKKVFTWVTVSGMDLESEISFVNDVMPVLTKAGCNASACHGSPAGKGGFKLSLFGYDPKADRDTIVEGAEGKRVNLEAPAKSLIVQQATGQTPHGGGKRFDVGSHEYQTLMAWLKAGAPGPADIEPTMETLDVYPSHIWLPKPEASQRLVATAHFSDGSSRDVTQKVVYVSNDDAIAAVEDTGIVTGARPGETALMLRFLGHVGVARVAVLPAWKAPAFPKVKENNFIDQIIDAKLKRLHITPSPLTSDEEFIRRAYLDVLGIIPTPEEVKGFKVDARPDKRARLIDQLLERPEYADYWALQWDDTLRNNPRLTRQGLVPYHLWLRQQVADNVPYDKFVRSLLTSLGKNAPATAEDKDYNAATNYFVVSRNPLDLASSTSQIFLGIRIECARCHNHPFEKWTQNDYYGFAAFFGGVRARGNNRAPRTVFLLNSLPRFRNRRRRRPTVVRNPATGKPAVPTPLDGEPLGKDANADVRVNLVDWMTSAENPYFAKNMVNRIWAHYLGRGIIEPVDDIRVTNPPSNPELLDALAQDFIKSGFDVKHMHRVILNSRAYQTSSRPNEYNKDDRANFARFYPRRLTAEQLYDSISQATGVFLPQRRARRRRGAGLGRYLQGMPGPIERVMQVPLPRVPGPAGQFLDIFGKPRREEVCSCERSSEGNVSQALAMLNSTTINAKISSPSGRLRQIQTTMDDLDQQVSEVYLAVLTRRPKGSEVKEASALISAAESRAQGLEDLMWSLLNSREFIFNH